jgi:hypothetical protein
MGLLKSDLNRHGKDREAKRRQRQGIGRNQYDSEKHPGHAQENWIPAEPEQTAFDELRGLLIGDTDPPRAPHLELRQSGNDDSSQHHDKPEQLNSGRMCPLEGSGELFEERPSCTQGEDAQQHGERKTKCCLAHTLGRVSIQYVDGSTAFLGDTQGARDECCRMQRQQGKWSLAEQFGEIE